MFFYSTEFSNKIASGYTGESVSASPISLCMQCKINKKSGSMPPNLQKFGSFFRIRVLRFKLLLGSGRVRVKKFQDKTKYAQYRTYDWLPVDCYYINYGKTNKKGQ
jgi:hypothetical protein